MRIIKYKSADSVKFRNFIDIGSCQRDSNHIKSVRKYFECYNTWFDNFKNESIGARMIIVNYYLFEYLGWNKGENSPQDEYFSQVYDAMTLSVLRKHLNNLLHFNDKWFYYQSSLFKCLDLDFDEIEESIVNIEENEDGIKSKIEFEDGSSIHFLDEDDSIKSFYVREEDYLELKNSIDNIVNMFKP